MAFAIADNQPIQISENPNNAQARIHRRILCRRGDRLDYGRRAAFSVIKVGRQRTSHRARTREHAASELTERRGTLTGPLRISAPVSFGTLHLGQALFGFLARYPGIELTLELDDRFVDIQGEGYDAIVRHGPVDDDRIIVKRLSASRRVLVASADYLKRFGNPTSLQDLGQHRGIMYGNRGAADWRFRVGRKWVIARPQVALRVNNGLLMRDAAVAGLGIALLATFLLESPLKKRALKVLDIGAEAEGATLYIAYPEHLRSSAKIRALAAWLGRSIGEPAYWDTDFNRGSPRR
jgi:DNA-binding transcriptional LysR family regulator